MSKRVVIVLAIGIMVVVAGAAWILLRNDTETTTPDNGNGSIDQQVDSEDTDGLAQDESQDYIVDVYFSKSPESDDDPSFVFPVERMTDTLGVARFALDEILQGPSEAEREDGYYTNIQLSGESNCDGQDYLINIQDGVATVRFCRGLGLAGDLSGPRAEMQINNTLEQFVTVDRVIVLNRNGDCAFDLSGQNRCLNGETL